MYTPDGKAITDNIQVDVRVLYKTPIPSYSSKSQHSRSERPSLLREESISSVISASTNGQGLGVQGQGGQGQGGQVQGRFASPTTGMFRSGSATTDKQVSSPPTSPLKTGTNKPSGLGLGGSGNHISFQPTQATARLFNQQSIHSISEQKHRSPTTTNPESDVAGEYLTRPNYIAVSSAFNNNDSTIPSGIMSPLSPYNTTSDSLMASPSTSPRSNGFSTKVNYSTKNNVDFDTSTKTINSNIHSLKVSFLPPTHSGGGGGGGGGGCGGGGDHPTSPINQSPSVASSTKGRNRALIRRSVGSSAWPRAPRSMKRGGDGCIQGANNTEVCSVIT